MTQPVKFKRAQFLLGLSGLLLWPRLALADEACIQGVVVNSAQSETEPVRDAEIRLESVPPSIDSERTTTSGSRGVYQLNDVQNGTYRLVVTKVGFHPYSKTVKFSKGIVPLSVHVAMVPLGISMIRDNPIGSGTLYVAYAEPASKLPPSSPLDPFVYHKTIPSGGHPFNGGPRPMRINDQLGNPITTDKNHLMALYPHDPTKANFTPLNVVPYWIAFNTTGTRMYLTSSFKAVGIYDTSNGGHRLICNIPYQGIANGLSLSPDGKTLAVSILGCGVMLIDTSSEQSRGILKGCADPNSVVHAGDWIYCSTTGPGPGKVVAIDAVAGSIKQTIQVGNIPTDLALSPNGRHLYCVNSASASVSVIDRVQLKEIAKIPVGVSPQKLAISPNGSRIFVTNRQSNSVSVIDGNAMACISTEQVDNGPVAVVFNREGTQAYVACHESGNIVFLNGNTGRLEHSSVPMPISSPWGLAIRP